MTTKEAYERAKALAQRGEYEAALQALIGYEHPKIEALRQQIREAAGTRKPKQEVTSEAVAAGIKQAEKEKGKAMGQGCLVLIAIMVVCFVIFTATNQPSLEKSRAIVCVDALRGMPMGTRCRLDEFPEAVEACYSRLGDNADINAWYDCLLEYGVGSNMLDFPE